MRKLYELKNQRAEFLTAAKNALEKKDMETYNAKMAEVKALNADIEAQEALDAEEGRFEDDDHQMKNLHQAQQQKKTEDALQNSLNAVRSGNDYANAWADAIKNGIPVRKAMKNEAYKPLLNALTIAGGSPIGADGGFLVPIDFDNMIHTLEKDMVRLANYFNVETVTVPSGWRAVETTATRKKLPLIGEGKPIGQTDQPSFKKVEYNIKKYGDRIAVSRELMDDNTAGLMQYLADWFTPRKVMTENDLLISLLSALEAKNLTAGKEIKELKSVLNKSLNTAISRNATLLCNQSSYDWLDQLEDKNGRPMLVPNPADPDVYRFKTRPVVSADDDLIPNREITTTGDTKGEYYPMYIGNFKAFGTLFIRKALEFATTDVGGNAWENDAPEVRGICRMDAQMVDEKAAVHREIFVPAI